MIWIVRIFEVLYNFEYRQAEAVRVFASTQDEAEQVARKLWTTWMEQHPLTPSTMSVSGTSAKERGIE